MKMNSNIQTTNKISYDNIKEMVIVQDFEKHKYNLPEHGVYHKTKTHLVTSHKQSKLPSALMS